MRRLGRWLALAFLAASTPAGACSMAPGYRVPTSLELALRADTILLGVVEGELPSRDQFPGRVIVRPTMLIKGARLPAEVKMVGQLSAGAYRAVPSDPRDLINPNPGALTGGCIRDVFDKGSLLLLFLERVGGELTPANYSFARTTEDVPSPDSLWVRAVRFYVEVDALPTRQRRAAMIARRDQLRASSDPDSKLLAEDIDRQLRRKRIPPYD